MKCFVENSEYSKYFKEVFGCTFKINNGIVKDEDGEYSYKLGDVFIYPANIFHEIYNNGDMESEFVFIRIHSNMTNK